ncbi:MAG: threonine--tRNA ligase [Candidatus Paceibacterota bacterium]|jgi:threonyl-tRNA synthetase|nr:threonine--tRNA ligase [Candidatus Paceibacterota bacterium]MDD4831076.1 threonine--tRNA ligase [Candidatus Paceibacterota bacterium]MDD4875459.1 threonine--tRNA ligase [Candidatus Paceibacterota bacterium]
MEEQSKKNILRHSTAHILAAAVLEIFPEAKFAIGPSIENGFYYDFDLPRSLNQEDLPEIEKRMKKIIEKNLKFERKEISAREAIDFFKNKNQPYKVELIEDLAKDEKAEKVTLYSLGDFVDLCRGPHLESSGKVNKKSFKLMKTAGAYWKGDEKNKMLQRVYGTVWENEEELEDYLKKLEEAEKRDHRKLGKELDLFHIDEQVGLGLILWHPKGAMVWRMIEDFWYQEHMKKGYDLVRSPHIGNRRLWEQSGHWGFYSDSMYPPLEAGQSLEDLKAGEKVGESEQYLLKPMNCPFHIAIYKNSPHSYRELPMRWAETGTVYRFEKKGELSGLTRVRGFTQDDAHIICRKDQVESELEEVIDFILHIYKAFGFDENSVKVYLSLRDPEAKNKYAGDDAGWEFTEDVLRKAAQNKKLPFTEEKGEAAFYGPKLDFKIKDVLGREWQCSTLQFDFNLPEKFEMSFVNDKGEQEKPYVLHRALFGSFERFIGLLIENYAGAFPAWLAPEQVWVLPIAERHQEYADKIARKLKEENIRVVVKGESETVGKKIRAGQMQKIPYLLVAGDKEIEAEGVAVRDRTKGDLGTISLEEFISKIKKEIKEKK